MDEVKDPDQWIQIDESNFSDIDLSQESDSQENQQANVDSQNINYNEQNLNEDKYIDLGYQLNNRDENNKVGEAHEQYIQGSFGYQENNYNNQNFNPFLSPSYVEDENVQIKNYQPQSSRINQNLEHSVFEQTSYNQLEQSQLQSSFLNTSILQLQQKQVNYLDSSLLPDFMSKSHIDKLNRGNFIISIQKKKTVYQINISSFQKIQNQYTSYVVYIINSSWSDSSQEIKHTVKRRFNEFKNLNQYVSKKFMGNVQPSFPLPTIQETILPVIKLIKDEQNYLEDRQKKLETYLKKLAQCDFILDNEVFEKFLSSQDEFNEIYDEKKEQPTLTQQYLTTFQEMYRNIKSLIYQQEIPYLSIEDQDQQDQLRNQIKQIQETKNILIVLINEIQKTPYEELEQYLKNGENAAEIEITQLDQQNMNFQQNFLSEFYKKYSIQSEKRITNQLSQFLEEIIDQFNDAEKSYENFMTERNNLIQQLSKEKEKEKVNVQNDENTQPNQQDAQINEIKYLMENTHIKVIKAHDNNEVQQDNSDNDNEQMQQGNQILTTKCNLQSAGKNLIQEFSILLTIKYPSKFSQFNDKVRFCYLNHYKQEIQLYEEVLNPLLF
ncbi:PX-SNX-like domain protein (macronuclear) [Tetrahymena thermophila SB210]|uniref:PX-SNX-like domain protein n=1 Tax=Tetrahymena thermophila (strain SB210) TaxID=312017 RepID=I7MM50_TETTS|nr:PX-SNX-like domain protein [Tetrahymena thermophila SB210]EAS03968.2 PX-SNX-like domain protein [Tetrahymena thermophila SB210]|eukprot:XP_001024213.2 PX-SNX-like domain protein [Tetrahymena thermophila SB210]